MRITIESTTRMVEVNGVECRQWEGVTGSGVKVQCLVVRIAAHENDDLAAFSRELSECRAPEPVPQAFPLRMLI